MNAHTPAPWKFTEGEYFYVNARVDGKRIFILQRKKSVVSAATAYQEAEEDRIRADCHLIAAAPELLEALSRLMVHANWMQSCSQDDDEIERNIARARAAIAKAEAK